MSHQINRARIKAIAIALEELNEQVVFVGGAAVSLYGDETQIPDHRPTDDIDVIIEMATYGQFAQIQDRLRALGFREDAFSRVICRWTFEDIIVDIMPLDDKLWGFSNVWYQRAYPFRELIELDGISVYRLPVSYFLLTKWEALKNRDGGIDWRWSQDFEDMVKIMVGTKEWQDISELNIETKMAYLGIFRSMIQDEAFLHESVRTQLSPNYFGDQAIDDLASNIKRLIK
ncbi:MAG: hypothetical protein IPL46_13380 [Saprospiraceae bacterium]|nr:hypothetical protein [Saprospiraceae bacterium]